MKMITISCQRLGATFSILTSFLPNKHTYTITIRQLLKFVNVVSLTLMFERPAPTEKSLQPSVRTFPSLKKGWDMGLLIHKKTREIDVYGFSDGDFYIPSDFMEHKNDYLVISDNQFLAKTLHARVLESFAKSKQ